MPKLTQKFIKSKVEVPPSGQVFYRDTVLPGFGLRVTPGSKSYIVEGRVNGVFRRVTVGKCDALSPDQARKKARRILAMFASGRDPVHEKAEDKASSVTLQQVLNQYLEVRNLRPNSRRLYRNVVTYRLGDWLSLPITQITRSMIETRHREISTVNGAWKASKSQANMTMKVLKLLLNFAADTYQVNSQPILLSNPVRTLSQSKSWHRLPPRQGIVPDHKLPAYPEWKTIPSGGTNAAGLAGCAVSWSG